MATAEMNLEQLNKVLDDYDKTHFLNFKTNNDTLKYLELTREELQKYTDADCGEVAAILALFSSSLQKETNRQRATVGWCESNLQILTTPKLDNYKANYQTFEERRLLATMGDSYCDTLNRLRIKAQTRLSEIEGMSYKIDLYIKTLLELQQTKRRSK